MIINDKPFVGVTCTSVYPLVSSAQKVLIAIELIMIDNIDLVKVLK